MNKDLIVLENVSKHYYKKQALKNVSLNLGSGKIIGLLGPNGSGKTTLIKILNGLLKEYEGQVKVDGGFVGTHSRSIISYLPDEPYFQDWMYAKDALRLFKDMYQDFDYQRCVSLMDRFSLTEDMKIKSMSKGMREKFQLSLVMSRRAKIYILDEPIAGVDPAARDVILDVILNNYEEDSIVLISTHLISDLETIFDEVVFIKEGEIVLHQDTESLRQETKKSIDELFREVFRC
ncbi:MAG: ABC transporter ATP-binding protein [Coprobacillaceae bacterium]